MCARRSGLQLEGKTAPITSLHTVFNSRALGQSHRVLNFKRSAPANPGTLESSCRVPYRLGNRAKTWQQKEIRYLDRPG